MAPVRVVRAFRIPITAIITALALSGCMRTTGPVAVAPQGDLDSMAYGQPNSPPPQAVAASSGGGAIGALRAAFAAAPRAVPAPVVFAAPVAYVEPVPVRYDAAYHLDAGDKLRVVVYGQEGLTNTYAIDAGGSITMPLIGSVRARGEKPPAIATALSTVMLGTYGYCPGAATSPRMKKGRYASISTATDGSLMKPARSFADISAASPAVGGGGPPPRPHQRHRGEGAPPQRLGVVRWEKEGANKPQ
jgi:hypothetical protein